MKNKTLMIFMVSTVVVQATDVRTVGQETQKTSWYQIPEEGDQAECNCYKGHGCWDTTKATTGCVLAWLCCIPFCGKEVGHAWIHFFAPPPVRSSHQESYYIGDEKKASEFIKKEEVSKMVARNKTLDMLTE